MTTVQSRAVTWLAVRQLWRGALVVAAVSAAMPAVVVASHAAVMADRAAAAALDSLAGNPAIRTMFGEPVALHDPGGFAVWRTGTALAVLLAVWGLLAATRLLRGEEDTGRWNLLLAGRLPVTGVVLRYLTVLAGAMLVTGTAVTAALIGSGTTARGAIVYAAGLALVGAFFTAAGALSAQLFPSRPAATGAATALLLVTLLTRMVGDGVDALGWLRWASPYGLLALTGPFHDNTLAPLAVLAVATLATATAAIALAGRRDTGAGLLTPAGTRAPRTRLLGSPAAFAVRQAIPPWSGWAAGIAAYYALIGLLTSSMTAFLTDNPTFAGLAARAGFGSLTTVTGYTATLFALLAVPAGTYTAVRLGALAAAERDRHLTLLLARPVSRSRLALAETTVTLAGATLLLLVAAAATWTGTTTVDAALGPAAAVAGTLNVLPVVLLCSGAAVLALGWYPRAVTAAGTLPAVGGFLLHVIAQTSGAPAWIGALTPFAHLAAVPHDPPNWTAALVMTTVATAAMAIGLIGLRRRDLDG